MALWQANRVREAIEKNSGRSVEIVTVKTSGDRFATASYDQIGVAGVFTKELEEALFDHRADIAIHSMKDVPTDFADTCRIVTVFHRDDPRDVLVSQDNTPLDRLPRGARIGTSSLRRGSQLRAYRRDFEIVEIRGNVETRLRKVESGEYEAVVVAKAGLDRLGFASRITEILPPEVVLPAVGQGALCAEYFEPVGDVVLPLLKPMQHRETTLAVSAERALQSELQGGCRVPLGAWARFEDSHKGGAKMMLDACVLSTDGTKRIQRSGSVMCGSIAEARAFGQAIAKGMIEAGADKILRLAGRSVGQS